MEVIANKNIDKQVGLTDLEELHLDLLRIDTNSNNALSRQIMNNLIAKVDIIIKKIKYNPRLPFYDIEREIINICKIDPSTNGVVVKILFTKRFGKIDSSKLSQLTINV